MSTFYGFAERAKRDTIDYLSRLFDLYERGYVNFSDGATSVRFSKKPDVRTIEEWKALSENPADPSKLQARTYPAVLVGQVSGQLQDLSFTSTLPPRVATIPGGNMIYPLLSAGGQALGSFLDIVDGDGDDPNEVVVGGSSELSVELTCVARSSPEAGNLRDVVAMFLAHPFFKALQFSRYGIFSIRAPRLGGEASADDPQSDFKMYERTLSFDVRGDWSSGTIKVQPVLAAFFGVEIDP